MIDAPQAEENVKRRKRKKSPSRGDSGLVSQ